MPGNNVAKVGLSVLLFSFGVLLTTCSIAKVGLGAAVDITVPTGTITEPAADGTYASGTIVLTGTAKDDIEVKAVNVLYPTASGTVSVPATLTGNAWSVSLASGSGATKDVADGSDSIQVAITDSSGKTSTLTRLVYVDNKPPMVLVTSPSSYGSAPPTYGDYVDIAGQAYDASPVTSVTVTLAYTSGGTVKTVSQTADGTYAWSSRFLLKDSKGGFLASSNTGQILYYQVVVKDQAGNANAYYYHTQDIYTLLAEGTLFPTIKELGLLEQGGTSPSSPSNLTYASLVASRIPNATTSGADLQFTYETPPTVDYLNLSVDEPTSNVLAPGSVIAGTITPPAGSGSITVSSVEFWVYRYSDYKASGSAAPAALHLTAASPGAKNQLTLAAVGSSDSFRVSLVDDTGTDLPASRYVLRTKAKASGSDSVYDATVTFGIDASSPTLTETSIGDTLALKKQTFTLSGTAASQSGLASIVIRQSGDGGETWTEVKTLTYDETSTSTAWAQTVTPSTDGAYTYSIVLTTATGSKATLYRSVTFDKTSPVLSATAPTPGSWSSGSQLSLAGTASDGSGTGVARIYYLVDGAANDHSTDVAQWITAGATGTPTSTTSETWRTAGGLTSSWTTDGTTTSLPEGLFQVWVVAVDKAGNATTLKLIGASDILSGTTYTIAALGNTSFTSLGATANTVGLSFSATAAGSGTGKAWTGTGMLVPFGVDTAPPVLTVDPSSATVSKNTASAFLGFTGTASDTNPAGPPTLAVTYTKDLVAQPSASVPLAGTTWAWNPFAAPVNTATHANDGSYSFLFTATDVMGRTATQSRSLTIDTASPTLTITNPTPDEAVENTGYTFRGTASDTGVGVTSLKWTLDDWLTPTDIVVSGTSWSANFTAAKLGSQGLKTLKVQASDGVNDPTTASVDFYYDTVAPTLTETTVGTETTVYTSGALDLAGVATDNVAFQQLVLTSVYTPASGSPETHTSTLTPSAGTWTYHLGALEGSLLRQGTYALNFVASDKAGHTTTVNRTVVVDTTAPVVTPDDSAVLADASVKLTGSASDNVALARVEYQFNSTAGAWTSTTGTDSWSLSTNLASTPEGVQTVYVRATDKAGMTTIATVVVNVDHANPRANFAASTAMTSVGGLPSINGSLTLAGVADDAGYTAGRWAASATLGYVKDGATAVSAPGFVFTPSTGTWSWTKSVDGGGHTDDGLYVFTLAVTDAYAKTTTVSQTVKIDTTAPSLNVTSPTTNELVTSGTYTVRGSALDSGVGLKEVLYRLDSSSSWTSLTASSWSAALSLAGEGARTLSVKAVDNLGNTTDVVDIPFHYDRAAPTLTVANPASTQYVNATTPVTFNGTWTETNQLTSLEISYQKDSGPEVVFQTLTPNAAGTAVAWASNPINALDEGSYVFSFQATDAAGRTSSVVTRPVVIDKTAPVPTINTISATGYINTATKTVSGSFSPADATVKTVEVRLDSGAWTNANFTSGDNSWTYALSGLAEGTHTIEVRATDLAGNASTVPVTQGWVVDLAPPTLTDTSDAGLSTGYVGSDFTIRGQFSDSVGFSATPDFTLGLTKDGVTLPVSVTPTRTSTSPDTWVFSYTVVLGTVDSGTYRATVTVKDASGQVATLVKTVDIDRVAPTATISAPGSTGYVSGNAYVARGTSSDAASGVGTLSYQLDGGAWTAMTVANNWTLNLDLSNASAATYLPEGPHTLSVRAVDKAGNPSPVSSVTFMVDQSPPSLTESGVAGSANASDATSSATKNGNFALSGTVGDTNALSSAAPLTVSIDGGAPVNLDTLGSPYAATLTGSDWTLGVTTGNGKLADGVHTFGFTATDAAGRTTALTRTVTVDTTAPTLVPDASSVSADTTVKLTGTAADNIALAKVEYQIGSTTGAWTSTTGTDSWSASVNFTGVAEGAQTLYLRATDKAGWTSTTAVVVNVDHNAPRATFGSSTGLVVVSSMASAADAFTLAGTADDNGYNPSLVPRRPAASAVLTYSKDGATSETASGVVFSADDGTWTWTKTVDKATHADDGLYVFTLTVTDNYAKTTTVTQTVKIDTTAPTLSVATPTANDLNTTGSYTIQGSALDLGTGLDASAVTYVLTTNGVASAPGTANLSGSNWSKTLTLTTEGTYTLTVTAQDRLGNTVSSAPVTFFFDQAKPVLKETALGTTNTVYKSASFVLSGTWTETNKLSTLTITYQRDDDSTDVLVQTLAPNAAGTDVAWSSAPFSLAGHPDGEYVFTLTATDVAGRVATVTRTVRIDTTPPTVAPSAVGSSYYDSSVTVSGTAVDPGSAAAGVQRVQYQLGSTSGPWLDVDGTTNWSKTIALTTVAEGPVTVYFQAIDNGGKVSAPASVVVNVDHAAPQATLAATGTLTTVASVVTTRAPFTLGGLASDAAVTPGRAAASASLTYAQDGGAATTVTLTPGAGSTWSWNSTDPRSDGSNASLTDGAHDGLYAFTLTVTDVAGKTTSATQSVRVDTTAPTVTITAPSEGGWVSTTALSVTGVASDGSGAGVASTYIKVDNASVDHSAEDPTVAANGWTLVVGKTSWSTDASSFTVTGEGTKTLWAKAVDNIGNVSTASSALATRVNFGLDTAAPSLGFTDTTGTAVNGNFVLAGSLVDSNPNGAPGLSVLVDQTVTATVPVNADGTWTLAETVASLSQGSHTFLFTGRDVSGKTTSLSRTITVDTSAPTISVDGITAGLNSLVNEVNGPMTFRFGTDDQGLGIERDPDTGKYVAYYLLRIHSTTAPATTPAAVATWTKVISTSSVFTITVDTTAYADGNYDLYVGVRDAVGGSAPNTAALKYSPTTPTAPLATDISLTIDQSSDRPVLGFNNLSVSAVQNMDNVLGKSPTILLSVQDDDKVDVSTLEYRIDVDNDGQFTSTKDFWNGSDPTVPNGVTTDKWENEATWYPVDVKPSSDGSLVQAQILLTNFPQGLFGIQVRAKDNSTSGSTWAQAGIFGNASNRTWQVSGVVPFAVDYGPPNLAASASGTGTYRSNFTVSGTTNHFIGVTKVTYSWDNGTTNTTVYANANPLAVIPASQMVAGVPYDIVAPGTTNWTTYGAGSNAVGTAFTATGPGAGTGTVRIDPTLSIHFSGTVDVSSLVTGGYTLTVTSVDLGGNQATQQIPVTIDKSAPSVTVLAPTAGTVVNGTFALNGQASDNLKVGAVFLWSGLTTAADPGLPSQNADGSYNPGGYQQIPGGTNPNLWSSTINTSAYGTAQADGFRLRVVAIDSLGNVGTPTEVAVTVNQETDRPTISLTNLNLSSPSRLPVGNISITGTVSDDDGVDPTGVQIRVDRNGDGAYTSTGEDWVDVSNPPPSASLLVSWSHNITDLTSQGLKHVQVRAHDTNTTNATTDYATGFGWKVGPSVAFYVDSGPPALELTAPTIGQRFNTNAFTVQGTTNDSNGIQQVTVWVDDNDNQAVDSGEELTFDGGSVAASAMVGNFTYTISQANGTDFTKLGATASAAGTVFVYNGNPVAAATAGTPGVLDHAPLITSHDAYTLNLPISNFSNAAKSTKAVQVTSYNMSWASTTRDLNIVYDPTAPTVTVSTPGDGATINGRVKISGLADDNYKLTAVYYSLVSSSAAAPSFPGGYTLLAGQTYSWNVVLDTTTMADGDYTLRMIGVDSAGNASVLGTDSQRTFHVLQSSDRPVVSVSSLSSNAGATAYDNLLPASLQISGTVGDDDGVAHQWVQIRTQKWNAGGGAYDAWSPWTTVSGPPSTDDILVTWSHTLTGYTDGLYQLQVRSADVNDSGSFADGAFSWNTSGTIPFAVDLSSPAGTITTPAQGAWARHNQTISGTSSDANGIKKVTIAYNTSNAYGDETTLFAAGSTYPVTQPWSTTYAATAQNNGLVNYRISITDAFNKVTTYERYFTVDTLAPTVQFSTPSAGAVVAGSLQTRGTATDANAIAKVYVKVNNNAGPGNWLPDAVTDPTAEGWTLASGTYNWSYRFKTTTLADGAATLYLMAEDSAGNRTEPTLVSSQVGFTVNQAVNLPTFTFTTANNTVLDNAGVVTGTVTAANGVDTSTLQISFDGGVTWRGVSTPGSNALSVNFSHALASGTGLAQSATPYSVLVRASDLGQSFADDPGQNIAPVSAVSTVLTIVKDDAPPSVAVSSLDNGLGAVTTLQGAYINNRLTLSGTATSGIGLAKVEARLTGVGAGTFNTVTNTGTGFSTWTWVQTGLSIAASSVNLEIKATDLAGLTSTQTYPILIDTTAPVVSIETPATNPDTKTGAYNGQITIKGSASDNIQVAKVYYQIADTDPGVPDAAFTGWTPAASTYSWSVPVDTKALNPTTTDKSFSLWMVSVDETGHPSSRQSVAFVVNQASDQPVITVSVPSVDQVFDSNAQASGTVSDDDGLATVEVSLDGGVFTAVTSPGTVSGKSLNWSHVLSTLADGAHTLRLRVRDSNFVDSTTTPNNETVSAVIPFHNDTQPPALGLTSVTVQARYTGDSDRVIASNFNGSYLNNDATLAFSATSANGVASVLVSPDGTNWTAATPAGSGVYTYPLSVDTVGHSFDGTRNIQYKAVDTYGKTSSGVLTVQVDTQAPALAFTSPATAPVTANSETQPATPANAPTVTGFGVVLQGTATDTNQIASLVLTGGIGTTPVTLTNSGSANNWKVAFGAAVNINTVYANATYANPVAITSGGTTAAGSLVTGSWYTIVSTGSTGWAAVGAGSSAVGTVFQATGPGSGTGTAYPTVWAFPVNLTAVDVAGNKTVETGWVNIDPNADKPILTISGPTNGQSVTGAFQVSGTVTDNDGPTNTVRVQIDYNGDGVYSAAYNVDGTGVLTTAFNNEAASKTLSTTNGAWSVLLNDAGQLNLSNLNTALGVTPAATGFLNLKVTPVDVNGTLGNTQTIQVYLDSTAPQISGVTTTAGPSPSGINGTLVRGNIVVNALFQDDGTLSASSLLYSLDGGTTFNPIPGGAITQVTSSNPYKYQVVLPINTATAVANGNGNLTVALKVTDQTYKQTSSTITYAVDNTPPTGAFNDPSAALSSTNGLFSFSGGSGSATNTTVNGTTNQVIGLASDSGSISGVDHVDVYFVKNGKFLDPANGSVNQQTVTTSSSADALLPITQTPVAAGSFVVGTQYTIVSLGTTNWTAIGASSNTVGLPFTATGSGSGTGVAESLVTGTTAQTGVPYTADAYTTANASGTHYAIRIDSRTELGQFDQNTTLGDQDGFQESLKSKSGYEQWYSYLDTTKLPDGPLSVYYVVYDQAGNKAYGVANGQITNYPPSITTIAVNGSSVNDAPWKFKNSMATVPIVVTATDGHGATQVDPSGWKISVLGQYGNGTDVATTATATYSSTQYTYTVGSTDAWTGTFTVNLAAAPFAAGYWYLLEAQTTDQDGNKAVKDFYVRTITSDTTAPVVTVNTINQTAVAPWTAKATPLSQSVTLNASTGTISATLPSWITATSQVAFAGTTAPTGLTPGAVYYVVNNTGSTFQLAATSGGTALAWTSTTGTFLLVSGGHVENAGNSQYNTANPAVSGAVLLSGTVYDDSEVSSLSISLDGGTYLPLTLTGRSGNVINGYTYNWTYLWDTSTITTGAKAGVKVAVKATDTAANTSTPTSNTVDVMPYITSITDTTTGLPTSLLRGATGTYSITKSTNTLNVYGYNLGNTSYAPTAWNGLTATAYTATGTTASQTPTPNAANPSNLLTVPKNWSRSGYFTVTVNGVPSLNNLDSNSGSNNSEVTASNPTTAKWNDDRFFWVWSTTQQVPATMTAGVTASLMTYYNPVMRMNGDQPEFAYNDDNGGVTAYTSSDTSAVAKTGYRKMASAGFAGATISSTYYRFFASAFDSMVGSGDNTGFLEISGWNANTASNNYGQYYGPSVPTDTNTPASTTIKWMTIQGNDFFAPWYTTTGGAYRYMNRFTRPQLQAAASTVNSGWANIWLTYYDASPYSQYLNFVSFAYSTTLTSSTYYKTGNVTPVTTGPSRNASVMVIPGTAGGHGSSSYGMSLVGTSGAVAVAYYDPIDNVLKLATSPAAYTANGTAGTGGTDNKTNLTANTVQTTVVNVTGSTLANFNGKSFTIYDRTTPWTVTFNTAATAHSISGTTLTVGLSGVTASTTAIASALATALETTVGSPFRDTPTTTTAAVTITAVAPGASTAPSIGTAGSVMSLGTTTYGTTNWTTTVIDGTAGAGMNVSLAADGTNLYMAYQDTTNGQLKFARVGWAGTGTPSTSTIQTVAIDGQPSIPTAVGSWSNIVMMNLTKLTGVNKSEPVIAYYADAYGGGKYPIRYAVPNFDAAGATTVLPGVDSSDAYTGNWITGTILAVSAPSGGDSRFGQVQLGGYSSSTLPVVGWTGSKPEYSKLQPFN